MRVWKVSSAVYKPRRTGQVKRLIERDGTRCHYCGVELEFEWSPTATNYRTVDHKQPQARNGKTLLKNLVLACPRCNLEKGVKSYQEFCLKKQTNSMILWLMDGNHD